MRMPVQKAGGFTHRMMYYSPSESPALLLLYKNQWKALYLKPELHENQLRLVM